MTAIEDRPTMPERYARAIESAHLELTLDERCAVDFLIAAGWAKETLGTGLYRLRAEFDSVRGQIQHYNEGFAVLGDDAENAALTARVMILSSLKSLAQSKAALGRFALLWATRQKYMKPDVVVMRIAGRALDYWLDPICHRCDGTGLIGAFGAPRSICTSCHGSKLRTLVLADDYAGQQFGRSLMNRMDSKCNYVTGQMRRWLSQR